VERCRLSVGKHRGCLEDYILENTYIYKWCVRGVCMEDEELTNEQEDLILAREDEFADDILIESKGGEKHGRN